MDSSSPLKAFYVFESRTEDGKQYFHGRWGGLHVTIAKDNQEGQENRWSVSVRSNDPRIRRRKRYERRLAERAAASEGGEE